MALDTPLRSKVGVRRRDLPAGALTGIAVLSAVIGVVARFIPRSDLWLDEALSVNIAKLPLGDIGEALRHDGHPPLYYWLLHGWMTAFGSSDNAVRALSAAIGVAWIPLLVVTARRIAPAGWERRIVPAAATVAAVLPYGVRYGAETRMYSLAILLATALLWLVVEQLERPRPLIAVGIAATTGILLWTHYWSIYLLAVLGLIALWRRAWTIAVALVAGGLTFLPWVPSFLYQAQHTGTPWGEVTRPTSNLVITLIDISGGPVSEAQLLSYLLAGLMVIAIVGHSLGDEGEEAAADVEHRGIRLGLPVRPQGVQLALIGVGTLLVGSLAAMAAGATFATRYIAVAYPLFVLLIALGAVVPATVWVRAVMLLAVLATGLVGLARDMTFDRTQMGVIAEEIADASAEDGTTPLVVVCPDQLGPATSRALEQRGIDTAGVLPYPTLGDPHFVDWVDYAQRNAAADPVTIADQVLERADGAPVMVVMNPGYLTFDGQCTGLLERLEAERGPSATLVEPNGAQYWETSFLYKVPGA